MEGNRQKVTTVDILRTDRESGAKLLEREYKARLCAVARRLGVDETEAEALAYRTIDEAVRAIDGYTEQSALFPLPFALLTASKAGGRRVEWKWRKKEARRSTCRWGRWWWGRRWSSRG